MGIEGRLTIDLSTEGGGVERVDIASSRPVYASRVFHGKRVAEALEMVPMLFTICGTAQACAAVRACERALGVESSRRVERLREGLVRMETLREHLWRILLDWPAFLNEPPRREGMTEMLALQRDYRRALVGERNPFTEPGVAGLEIPAPPRDELDRLSRMVECSVFGVSPSEWLAIDTPAALEAWAASGATVAARLIHRVVGEGWQADGRCEVAGLPILDTAELGRLLGEDAFIQRPEWAGDCRESSCLTRTESGLLRRLRERYGNGLLVRLAARLTEIGQLSLQPLPESGGDDDGPGNGAIGQVEAARGRLVHRVVLREERVVDYRILAPTEWNFHPRGVVARSLAALTGDKGGIEHRARLLINAIDPCVGYELRID